MTKDEIYAFDDQTGKLIIETDGDGNQIYAKRKNGDEYFPAPDIYLRNKDNKPIYPFKNNKTDIIFPKNSDGDEHYLRDENEYDIIQSDGEMIPRYARDRRQNEIYPIVLLDAYLFFHEEVIIGDQYAKWNNEPYYPFDAYGNEYTLEKMTNGILDEQASFPASYAITNDRFVIVPIVNNKPYILKNGSPHLTMKNILGKLFRWKGFHDYITNVISVRHSRSVQQIYSILPTGSSKEEKRIPHQLMKGPSIIPPKTTISTNLSKDCKKGTNWTIITLIIFLIISSIIILYQFIKN